MRATHERAQSPRAGRGFTLLEVMISIAILSLGLATVFGSTIMGARGSAHARMVTDASLMARCRMTELEAYLLTNGLPETEQNIEDPPDMNSERCCEGAFRCSARVEKIELPQPADVSTGAGNSMLNAAANAARGSSFAAPGAEGDGGLGAIGQLAGAMGALSGAGSPGGDLSSAMGGMGGSGLSGNGAPNLQAMASQLLSGIYPTIKPLMEGAIRKVTVHVAWNEGSREYGFDVVQYITNPGQTFQSGEILDRMQNGLTNTGGPPGGGPPSTTPPLPHP